MMARGVAHLASQGTKIAHLVVFTKNLRARRFYEKCGFRDCRPCVYNVQFSGGRTYPLSGLQWYEKVLSG